MPLSIGDKLGPYEILAPIGVGGMGEVYRARDARLRRTVAIKVLPHDKVADLERKRRFLQEARAASALNHPNIVTLYDIANDAGIDYLVMEYVPGKSLDKLITPEGLPMADFIGYSVQIAGALAAAHAAGIIHRDIKPANLIVTSDGHVKILDFGLAKLEERTPSPGDETRTMESALTDAGMVMGTVAYISPEQARAEEVDARADLFSFGVVLYEMATGHRPFLKPWDWSTPPEGSLAPRLRRIVFKLLEVKRELRYQRAADVATDLKQLQASKSRLAARPLWLAAAAALVIVSIAAAAFVYLRPHPPASRDQWIQLTSFPDSVSQPALSPDGRMLTFVRGPETFEGPGQVYVKLLPDGEPVQLTHDARNKMSPVFSPDGSRIAYTVGGWDTWAVAVVSGEPRLWLKNASGLLWIDRQKLLYSEQTHPEKNNHMGIFTAEESLAGKRSVYLPPVGGMAHRSYPSPDGKSVLVVEMQVGAWGPCRLLPLDGSSPGRTVGPPGAKCTFAGWSADGKWMYLSSSAGDSFHTWRQRYPDGQPEQITSGPTEEEGVAITPDGHAFITSVALKQSVVWVHDEKGERPISVEGYSFDPKITPDGKKLCYRILKGGLTTSDRSELRVVELDTGHNESLFPGLEITGEVGRAYDISADGREAVGGVQGTDGKQHLWIAALDRQSPPHLIPGVEGQTPLFGKDGEVFFRGDETGTKYVYGVHEDGTRLRKLSDMAVGLLQGISQDREWVVTGVRQDDGYKIMAFPAAGGPPLQVVSARASTVQHLGWSPDGKLIFFSETTQATATHIVGKTYIVPLLKGETFPKTPYTSQADLAKQPGVRVIDAYDTAPGPRPDVYAFSRAAVQRNLYRIPLP